MGGTEFGLADARLSKQHCRPKPKMRACLMFQLRGCPFSFGRQKTNGVVEAVCWEYGVNGQRNRMLGSPERLGWGKVCKEPYMASHRVAQGQEHSRRSATSYCGTHWHRGISPPQRDFSRMGNVIATTTSCSPSLWVLQGLYRWLAYSNGRYLLKRFRAN